MHVHPRLNIFAIMVALLCLLTACQQSQPTPYPTIADSASATPNATPVPVKSPADAASRLLYPLDTAAAPGSATGSFSVQVDDVTNTYLANTTYGVAGCKVLYYTGQLSRTAIAVGTQYSESQQALAGFLQARHAGGTTTHPAVLPTDERLGGRVALLETVAATYAQKDHTTTTVHARVFVNGRVIIYTQTCPTSAILDTLQRVRLHTA